MAYYTANKKIYSLFSNSSRYTVFSPKYYMGPVPGEFKNNNVYKSGGGGVGNRMHHLHAPHNIPCLSPKILHQHCLQFLLRRHYKMQNLAVGGILREMCTWNGAGRNSQLLFFFLFTALKLKSFIILWIIWAKRTHLLQCKCVLTDPKRLLISKNQYNDNFPWLPCIR